MQGYRVEKSDEVGELLPSLHVSRVSLHNYESIKANGIWNMWSREHTATAASNKKSAAELLPSSHISTHGRSVGQPLLNLTLELLPRRLLLHSGL